MKTLHPIEIEVHYILPTIRKYFALELKSKGLSQKEISRILSVKESTISQYINDKRASKIEFNKGIQKQIKQSTNNLKSPKDLIKEINTILELTRKNKTICQIHKKFSNIPLNCDPYKMGCIK